MSHIIVVGSLNMDLVVRAPHLPIPGETVLGNDFQTIPGGKGANQAVGAARLGANVTMIGCVGNDDFGKSLRANLQKEGVDTTHILTIPDSPTGIAAITLDEDGQNCIVVASGANMKLTPEDVEKAFSQIEKVDVVILQLEIPLDCVEAAARLGQERGAKIVLNPAPARQLSDILLSQTDVLVPNESETSPLTDLPVDTPSQAETAAQSLFDKGVGSVILTLGSRGALVLDGNSPATQLSPHQVDVIDTTAAGDAFVAGLSVGLGEGMSLVEAAKLGNATGALAVTKLGAQPAMPTQEEVSSLCNSLEFQ